MKNTVLSFLILLFVLPAFTPWLSHGGMHALHDHQATHHGEYSHDHDHEHATEGETNVKHPVHLDAVMYFSDYLHVNLQTPEQPILKAPVFSSYSIGYPLTVAETALQDYQLASIENRAPPDIQWRRPDKAPIYLSTLRLRI